MNQPYLCEPAEIEWQGNAPFSKTYGDIYWHRDGAVEEKQQVFIKPLQSLAAGLARCSQVTVCELGFGFGINCLLAADFWATMPADCQLNLVSIEKHPVDLHSLGKLLNQYDFKTAGDLLAHYPPPFRGQHVIWLAHNVRLLLVLDDVETALANLDAEVDLWFLDGFAPSRNDAMWQARLFRKMFARSRAGARVATYSAAGLVKRGLESSGFRTEKHPGFADKKEMLSASKAGDWSARSHDAGLTTIVGAGLAGLYCAEALQRRGARYQVIDSGMPHASSIPQLTVKPQLAITPEVKYRFSLNGLRYMFDSPGFYQTGVSWCGKSVDERERLARIAELFPDEYIESQGDDVVFHQAGWLSFSELANALSIPVTQDTVTGYRQEADSWLAECQSGQHHQSQNLIVATGANRALLHHQLQVRAIRGQAVSVSTRDIGRVLNQAVTVFPTINGRSVVSGTYARLDNLDVDPAETDELIAAATAVAAIDASHPEPHVGVRAVSRDRLPLVGQEPDWQALAEINRVTAIDQFNEGLYLCTAFGSRGATHARLCAEHIVSKIMAEPAALDLKQQAMLSPARFYLRDNRQG